MISLILTFILIYEIIIEHNKIITTYSHNRKLLKVHGLAARIANKIIVVDSMLLKIDYSKLTIIAC